MAKSKLVKTNKKIAEKVAGAYQKVEDTVVGAYQKVEDTVVGIYQNRGQICGPVFDQGRRNRRAGKAKAKGRKREKGKENGGRNKHPAAVFVADRGV